MGFFSRLFQPRADGLQAPSDWTRLPDSNASELVLFDEEAHKLMAQFDIDAAIVTHQRWLPWLGQVLQGARDENLRPEAVADDGRSELGQWLHGSGRAALGHLPAFDMLMRRHRFFHQQAAALIRHAEAGEGLQAEQAHKACQHASRQVVLLLKELQRGLMTRRPVAAR
ncbi:MAG: CZB domain-containing protein [Comamonadaceae bacterium]|nr:CZB domain-containing protein [Pseudomonadota bacterium]MBS0609039.1 CZB domain-containing protein [Pseudomonadota bacterium]MDE2415675.1 CZB domain-containing protein [Comamonadaceae bacterium]